MPKLNPLRSVNLLAEELPNWNAELEVAAITEESWSGEKNAPQAEAISVASVWQMDSPESANAALAGETGAFVYRRDGHPNERHLAAKLAKLHCAGGAAVTAQGMSALAAVGLTLLKPGDHIAISRELYGKTSKLFLTNMQAWGVHCETFDPTSEADLNSLAKKSIQMLIVETMSNPTLKLPDLSAITSLCKDQNAILVVDNTFATHLLCQPLEMGADIVVESLSKLVNGHSDSMLGLVATKQAEMHASIADTISTFGLASSPLDCYLTHRGLMSLALRLERACNNALHLARRLNENPHILSVDYPGLAEHPQHDLAKAQLKQGFGWMLSFHTSLDRSGVVKLIQKLMPAVKFVPSLGDIATTISHPATTSHRGYTEEQRLALGISEGTIRVSCGVEPTDWLVDLIEDAINNTFE